jgi:hypothetical protein
MAAWLILFQFHAQFSFGALSINLADAFALLGLGVVAVEAVLLRQAPCWRIRGVNRWAIAASLALLLAFAIGAWHIGITGWALSNRLLGWFVLLGYAALGAWFARMHGRHGLRRLVDYLAACAAAIVLAQIGLRVLAGYGWSPVELTPNFEGYAANRNAFAFQMLACLAALLAGSSIRARHGRTRWHDAALAIVLAGVWLSQSRAALGTALAMLALAWLLRWADRATLMRGIAGAALLLGFLALFFMDVFFSHTGMGIPLLDPGYDSLRWESMRAGLSMWLAAPVFGAGLGVFLHDSARLFPVPMVIHSTPVWWLAEFGLAGFTVFAGGLAGVAWWGFRHARRPHHAPARLAILLALAFAIFGLVHDIFAQRIFWFLLGAALALPAAARLMPHDNATPNAAFTRLQDEP